MNLLNEKNNNKKNHRLCIYDNCMKYSTFNLPTEKKSLYCSLHKLDNMINVKNKKCICKDCKKIPSFNIENDFNGNSHLSFTYLTIKTKSPLISLPIKFDSEFKLPSLFFILNII